MMQDRFKLRVWSSKQHKYLTNDDVLEMSCGYLNNIYCLLSEIQEHIREYIINSLDDEFTFEQCTGLKDKNGDLIYEGDMVKITDKYHTYKIQPVDYCNSVAAYWFHRAGYVGMLEQDCELEIVGNCHENLDLLEEN